MIYFQMVADILTAGHIRVLEKLSKEDELIVGLFDEKAIKGYKDDTITSYEDRKTIFGAIKWVDRVVRQSSLNPYENLIKYKITHIASGDGWEQDELEAAEKAGVKIIDIKLEGEKGDNKLYSSRGVKKKIKEQYGK